MENSDLQGRARTAGLFIGPGLFIVLLALSPPEGMAPVAWRTAALAGWIAVWWMTEAVAIPATALLPILFIPILGIADIKTATAPYADKVIFLFMGGFMLAQTVQKWDLHKRLALKILSFTGTRAGWMIASLMLVTAFLSMWVSNTATVIMMMPIGVSIIRLVHDQLEQEAGAERASNFAICLMLGLAYSASIGGVGTLIGTPPNALFAGFMSKTYNTTIGFAEWMKIGLPVVVVSLPLCWLVLTRLVYPIKIKQIPGAQEMIRTEAAKLGPMSRGEILTGIVFLGTALAWIFRPLLNRYVAGLSDTGIAILAALILFACPVNLKKGEFLLDWKTASGLRWDVLLLFGGGLSLAGAINQSGLAAWIGASLSWVGGMPTLLVLVILTCIMVFLTELTSNTASTATFLPVIGALAIGVNQEPMLFLVPITLAASCAFMLPVATPPNAIVYGSGHIMMKHMVRAGLVLNLLCCILIPVYVRYFLNL